VIESVCSPQGNVLAYVVHADGPPRQTEFLTPPDCNLQVGHVVYAAGEQIPRHVHLPIERHIVGSVEVLIVQRGRCAVDVYTDARELVTTREMHAGDMLIAVGGGHGFRVLDDLVLLEIKQGPYPGGAEKERF
jgi:hypothetical protein